MRRHVIEVLYRERCPFVLTAIARVRSAIASRDRDVDIEIRLIQVDTMADAIARACRGSPSVQVDGVDVDPQAAFRPLGTHPRGYFDGEIVERAPPADWIRAAMAASPKRGPGRRRARLGA